MAATGDVGSIAVETVSTGELSAGTTAVVEPATQAIRAHHVSAIAAAVVSTAVSNAVTATVAASSAEASAESAAATARKSAATPATDPRSSLSLPKSTIEDGHSQNNGGSKKESVVHTDLSVAAPQSEWDTVTDGGLPDADGSSLRSTNDDIDSADREIEEETTGCGGDKEPRGAESLSHRIAPEGHDIAIPASGDNVFGAHPTAAVGLVANSDGRTTKAGEAKQAGGEGRVVYSGGPDDGATVWVAGNREAAVIQVRFWRTDIFFQGHCVIIYAQGWVAPLYTYNIA